ncbi:MAG: hypothetical protein KGZ35_01700 [Truepera sp.]|nr:hypothetical protein [Truepera sp.]
MRPFTVLAATSAAFAALPPEQLMAVLADCAALIEVTVVPAQLGATALGFAQTAKTVPGGSLAISRGEAGLVVGGANDPATVVACGEIGTGAGALQ